MYCRKCGNQIPDHATVCGYCGTPTDPNNPYTYGGTENPQGESTGVLGIVSMIIGIISILLACCAGGKFLTVLLAIVGLVLGIIALQKPGTANNHSMAVAGIICSVIAMVLKIIVVLLVGVGLGSLLFSRFYF